MWLTSCILDWGEESHDDHRVKLRSPEWWWSRRSATTAHDRAKLQSVCSWGVRCRMCLRGEWLQRIYAYDYSIIVVRWDREQNIHYAGDWSCMTITFITKSKRDHISFNRPEGRLYTTSTRAAVTIPDDQPAAIYSTEKVKISPRFWDQYLRWFLCTTTEGRDHVMVANSIYRMSNSFALHSYKWACSYDRYNKLLGFISYELMLLKVKNWCKLSLTILLVVVVVAQGYTIYIKCASEVERTYALIYIFIHIYTYFYIFCSTT